MRLLLASASPRRRELLSRAGVSFDVLPADIKESPHNGEAPGALVRRLAAEKAAAVSHLNPDRFVLAADTVVVLPEEGFVPGASSTETLQGEVLGKPESVQDARQMLSRLAGRSHYVITGCSLYQECSGLKENLLVSTEVHFADFGSDAVNAYAATGEGTDKAGAYAVQGIGACLVREVRGSYTNVVGLPLREVLELLEKHRLWSPDAMNKAAGDSDVS